MTLASTKTRAPRKRLRPARHWTALSLALAPALVVSLLVAPAAHAATVLFTDGFESGNFAAWTAVRTGGDGTATVQSATVKTGTYAARLTATAAAGSLAYARKSLAGTQTDLTASGDLQVQSEGKPGGSVPILGLFDAASTKLVSLNRQNKSGGIWVSYANTRNTTTASLSLNTWAQIQLHVVATGAATGTVDVVVNGATVYHSTTATLPATGLSSVQIGSDSASQAFAVVADNIWVGTGTPPTNTSPPTISGNAVLGSTLTASPGSWSGNTPITYASQWQRCDSAGANCNAVSGATSSAYALGAADVGNTMRVVVTATNSAGSGVATSIPTTVVQSGSTQSGLVALWHMDETSGSVMHDSVASHDGSLNSVALGQPGYLGTAFGFNGTSSYVSVPSSSDLNPGSSNITITIHLKTTSAPATPDWDLIRKGKSTTTGGEFKMEYQPSGQASCGFKGSVDHSELIAGPALNDGKWHTVQCVETSSTIKVVVDGQTFSKAATVGSIANDAPVVIGAHPGSEFFNGSLDEASIQIG